MLAALMYVLRRIASTTGIGPCVVDSSISLYHFWDVVTYVAKHSGKDNCDNQDGVGDGKYGRVFVLRCAACLA